MRADRPIRLIRKRESQAAAGLASEAQSNARAANPEREIKSVVSRWVREHRQRSEEFRRTFATLWQAGEVHLPTR